MGVLTSRELQTMLLGVSSPASAGEEAVAESFDLVGFLFPPAPSGNSRATFIDTDGDQITVELMDGVYRPEGDIEKVKEQFMAAGFVAVYEDKNGNREKEKEDDTVKTYTMRHPEFSEMKGSRPFYVCDDEYTMNDGVIRTQRENVKDSLLKYGFHIIDVKEGE